MRLSKLWQWIAFSLALRDTWPGEPRPARDVNERIGELLAANNIYLARARFAETRAKHLEEKLQRLLASAGATSVPSAAHERLHPRQWKEATR